ncbi:MAG: nitronate monooxygenase [Aquabacterium sp.]|nr:nitronate monooxygenase [Aquabacterium sp.]
MITTASPAARARAFCQRFGLRHPVLLAPMAGACPPGLSAAVMGAGGLGACGALLLAPAAIVQWADDVRAAADGPFQINLWVPDPAPVRDAAHEQAWCDVLAAWGPVVTPGAGDARPLDFTTQCDALLAARAPIASSVMGLFPPAFVQRLKAAGVAWWANISTVAEALAAEAAGADVVVAQGMEAGGHRGCFDAGLAEAQQVGLFSLLPAVADALRIPVVATGGIADARGVAAAFALGASAVQVGTGFLRAPEAGLPAAWADALARTAPEDTCLTRAFSGRAGRSIATGYVQASAAPGALLPAPYPVQRGLTAAMRQRAVADGDVQRMQAWAGQSARLAQALPAAGIVQQLAAGVPA